jgi:antigen 43
MTTKTLSDSTINTYYYSGSGVTLVNAGVQGAPGQNTGLNYGIYITGNNDTIVNKGAIYGQRSALYILGSGDSVINNAGKKIISTEPDRPAVNFYKYRGTVTNYGLISGYTNATHGILCNAVGLYDGGIVTNTGTLSNGGVYVGGAAGTITNSGVILGNLAVGAVLMKAGGTLTNLGGGLISANGATVAYQGVQPYGVWIEGGAATITNAGTIIGGGAGGTTGYAVKMATGVQNEVIVDTTGVFVGTVTGGTAADATLELASGASTGTLSGFGTQFTNFGTLEFAPSASWLVTTNTNISSATIDGFVQGDTIDITGFTATSITTLSGNKGIVLYSGATHETLSFGGAITNFEFTTGSFGTELTTICFCVGTLIDTPDGEVQVEKLCPGDIVSTAHNGPRKVIWVGKGKVLATRGRRSAATPVIVRKGALAPNVPHEDLRVTKAHALYIDDVLIPVEFLVNHKTILWDDRAQEVEIYHVELESHDVLIANGAPAESFRDDGNRWLFQNARSGWDLPPQEPYAPVLTGGPVVDAVWARLLGRAGPRDLPPLTDDPDLHLIVDGERMDAQEQHGSEYVFRLPSPPKSVVIASRSGVPCELGFARDPRPLGVALRRLTIRQGRKFWHLDADDERLTAGFHDYEPADDLRWTDGYAELPPEMFARFDRGAQVMLHLGGTTRYPDYGDRVAA